LQGASLWKVLKGPLLDLFPAKEPPQKNLTKKVGKTKEPPLSELPTNVYLCAYDPNTRNI
jgi:hypothetical protein